MNVLGSVILLGITISFFGVIYNSTTSNLVKNAPIDKCFCIIVGEQFKNTVSFKHIRGEKLRFFSVFRDDVFIYNGSDFKIGDIIVFDIVGSCDNKFCIYAGSELVFYGFFTPFN